MGMMVESTIVDQLRKAQGETNERLERLAVAQERTNQLLEWLGTLVAPVPVS